MKTHVIFFFYQKLIIRELLMVIVTFSVLFPNVVSTVPIDDAAGDDFQAATDAMMDIAKHINPKPEQSSSSKVKI